MIKSTRLSGTADRCIVLVDIFGLYPAVRASPSKVGRAAAKHCYRSPLQRYMLSGHPTLT